MADQFYVSPNKRLYRDSVGGVGTQVQVPVESINMTQYEIDQAMAGTWGPDVANAITSTNTPSGGSVMAQVATRSIIPNTKHASNKSLMMEANLVCPASIY